ncbi:methyltransferase [Polaromonas sp.]|uniref:methyltransferase n=1 Tax=Polaromonas sp. TaxID=1869339 RepID=UPI0025FA93A1|nr:methyltransferase [Polaromonas sp.]
MPFVPPEAAMPDNYLPEVRHQYEALPYPPCDPQDDHHRLAQTWLEDLPMINHYCFAGKQSFRQGFRALVAGGGTGDASIFLAEQLRGTNAQVVHLDMSAASIALAQERARIRSLTNISWVHDSLLNLPGLGLAPFDYINCSGVLHHLADPDLGLRALLGVLRTDEQPGSLGLMVYASTGRTGVYQMQSLLRMVNGTETDAQRKISTARALLASLPPGNWFLRGEDLHHDHRMGDAGLYDLLLHSQDRSYSVGELIDWLGDGPGGHGFHLSFSDVQRGRAPYQPHMVLGRQPPPFIEALRRLPQRQQYEMAELMIGDIITHSFYATRHAGTIAPYGDPAYIPFFFHEPLTGDVAAQVFGSSGGQPFRLSHQHSGVSLMVNPGQYGARILRLIDGERSFGEIFAQLRAEDAASAVIADDATLFADFKDCYDTLNALERLLLKHPQSLA